MKLELSELGRHEAYLRLYGILTSLPIIKDKTDEYLNLERKLAADLISYWKESYTKALKNIFNTIPDNSFEKAVEIISEGLTQSLGEKFGQSIVIRHTLQNYIRSTYEKSKKEFFKEAHFNLVDSRAVEVLTKHNCFWLGEHYGKHIGPKIAEITQQALEDGAGRKELADELRQALGGEAGDYKYWDVASSAALVRARSFGAIAGMEEAGIIEYEVLAMGDERTCEICSDMDGRVFSVYAARENINNVLNIEDPEKFKEAMPWQTESPKSLSNDSLTVLGMNLPPFHGRCRCTLVIASEVIPEAHTIEEANEIAIKRGVAHNADFEDIDITVANEFIKSVIENKKIVPELGAFDFVGNADKLFEFNCIMEFEKRSAKYPQINEDDLFQFIVEELRLEFYRNDAFAISSTPEVGRGIGLFPKYFSQGSIQNSLIKFSDHVKNKWSPIGCGTIKSIIEHEIGHQIDYLMKLREDKQILQYFNNLKKTDIINTLSEYASENIAEFIAEAWCEYRNNPKPRDISRKIVKRIFELKKERNL